MQNLPDIFAPAAPISPSLFSGRSIQYTLSSMLFNVLPTILEISECAEKQLEESVSYSSSWIARLYGCTCGMHVPVRA